MENLQSKIKTLERLKTVFIKKHGEEEYENRLNVLLESLLSAGETETDGEPITVVTEKKETMMIMIVTRVLTPWKVLHNSRLIT